MNIVHPVFTLNSGQGMPAVGMGTYKLNGREGVASMLEGITNGYRLLDSAFNYENEGSVGAAVRECGLPRGELFVTSKLPGRHQRYAEAVSTIEESLYRTGLDYLDLYLIHWPNPRQNLYVEAWQAMIEAQQKGLLRSIGVCNFLPEHIERLMAETGVCPAVNQIELHPFFPQDEALAFHRRHGIATQAWSPLGRKSDLLQSPLIADIGARLGKSVAQVVLRWQLQHGALPIPKSSNSERQRQNLAVFDFELSADDMAAIATLAKPDGRVGGQDPAVYEEF